MSVLRYARTVVGLQITGRHRLRQIDETPGCGCQIDRTGVKFCSQCGAHAWVKVKNPIPGYDPSLSRLNGVKIFSGTDDASDVLYVGTMLGSTKSRNVGTLYPLQPEELDDIKAVVKEATEKAGLWDESLFGIWTYIYASH